MGGGGDGRGALRRPGQGAGGAGGPAGGASVLERVRAARPRPPRSTTASKRMPPEGGGRAHRPAHSMPRPHPLQAAHASAFPVRFRRAASPARFGPAAFATTPPGGRSAQAAWTASPPPRTRNGTTPSPATATSPRGSPASSAIGRRRTPCRWSASGTGRPGSTRSRSCRRSCTNRGRFKRTIAAAGLPDVRLHDLRYGYATAFVGAGVPAQTVSGMLGHATVGITLDLDAHPDVGDRAAALERAVGMLGDAPAKAATGARPAPRVPLVTPGTAADREGRGRTRSRAAPARSVRRERPGS